MAEKSSPLVEAVRALDTNFTELERVGGKILEMDLKSDFDFDQVQRLLSRFAEYGEGVSKEVTSLSQHLNAARARAEEVANGVAAKAELFQARREERQAKFETFRVLGEKVKDLSSTLISFQRAPGETLSENDRASLKNTLGDFETRLNDLIAEAKQLRNDAQDSRMKSLEQNADSLSQTLLAIQQKIKTMDLAIHPENLN